MAQSHSHRAAFSRQPAHVILVDFRLPFEKDTCNNLSQTLEQFFSLVCTISGPARLPFFGLVALGNYPETLFPLQHVRGNYSRLQRALSELRQFHSEGAPRDPKAPGCLPQGLQEAVGMFRKQAQNLLQTAGYWGQLEVTVFTSLSPLVVVKQLEKVVREINLDSLKKVQVVSVSSPDQLTIVPEDMSVTSSQGSGSDGSSSGETSAGLVDFLTMDNDLLNLENFFKCWLHDCATESEHLQLVLPPAESGQDGDVLVIRCDLQERVLCPSQLPFHSNFNLCLDGQISKPGPGATGRGVAGYSVSVHRLRVLQKINTDNICESVLYGQPLVVRATSCWKLDWDELETNKHHFNALCSLLYQQNQALLACLEEDTPKPPAGRGFQYQLPTPRPRGHFLLLPSHTSTLLLKSLAVNELVLPVEVGATLETPTEESQVLVGNSLKQVEVGASFNPLLVECGLYDSLTYHLTKSMPATALPGKRKMLNLKPSSNSQIGRPEGRGRGVSWDTGRKLTGPAGYGRQTWDATLPPARNSKKPRQSRETSDGFPTEL